jgi:hypothetical protein
MLGIEMLGIEMLGIEMPAAAIARGRNESAMSKPAMSSAKSKGVV